MKKIVIFFLILFEFHCAQSQNGEIKNYTDAILHVTTTMLHDVINPPLAARYYAYILLAPQLVSEYLDDSTRLFRHILSTHKDLTLPRIKKKLFFDLETCAIYALYYTAERMLPSGSLIKKYRMEFEQRMPLRSNWINKKQKVFAKSISDYVLRIANQDGYNSIRMFPDYQPSKSPGRWFPTPPGYFSAVEPNWFRVKPFFLSNLDIYQVPSEVTFDLDEKSEFYKLTEEVYKTVNNISEEERWIANFWDCNPFEVVTSGHMTIGLKKITPGGHWIGIASIVSKKCDNTLKSSLFNHSLLALVLHDAFIVCWKEKYESDRIRPETVIRILFDKNWTPILQTPPFPEYTSGHSVISSAASTILTFLYGSNVSFVDDTEELFGISARTFNTFHEAAKEAAVSRIYGGIHFRDAVENGMLQGTTIASNILKRFIK